MKRTTSSRLLIINFSNIVSEHAGRWWLSLNVQAADLHPAHHRGRPDGDPARWVGIDRSLSAFLVAATSDGEEVARVDDAPRALVTGNVQAAAVGEIVVPHEERKALNEDVKP